VFAPISIPARAAALAACASQLHELNSIDSKNVSRIFYPPAFLLYSSNLCIWSSENLYKCSSPSENVFTSRTPIVTAPAEPGVRCASGARCGPVHLPHSCTHAPPSKMHVASPFWLLPCVLHKYCAHGHPRGTTTSAAKSHASIKFLLQLPLILLQIWELFC